MKKVWLMPFLVALGFVIVALPDSDKRLFSFSQGHGVSLLDGIGLIILLIGYGGLVTKSWKNRERVLRHKYSVYFGTALFLLVVGLLLVLFSVLNDYGYYWVFGVFLLVLVHTVFFYVALK